MAGVIITKTNGGLGRKNPSKDMYCGLLLQGVAPDSPPTAYNLGDVVKLQSVDDAAQYGLDADYDDTNNVLVYYHIKEFFRINPDGVLFIMVVAQTVTLTNMADKANPYVQSLITSDIAKGEIRAVAIGLNPDSGYTPTLNDGLDDDVNTSIPKAQELADAAFAAHYPLDIVIVEGRSFNGTITDAGDLTTLSAPNVAVCIGADPAISAAKDEYNSHACIGTCLGMVSKRKVNESIGWVGDSNITDVANADFLTAGLSSNLATSSYSAADLVNLEAKGYIFTRTYPGVDGVYFNADPTCDAASSDYNTIHANRTINKAARLIYTGLMPYTNSVIALNEDGTIRPEAAKALEGVGKDALNQMGQAQEISAYDVYIDPAQNILNTSNVDVKFQVVPTGIAKTLNATIGFTTSIN